MSVSKNNRGLIAKNLTIVEKATKTKYLNNKRNQDERVTCAGCGKKMVPRFIYLRGQPYQSVCPFCATTYAKFEYKYCFIATAVYGDYDYPKVQVLRQYRDEQLLTKFAGRIFVEFYYFCSPPIADWLSKHHTSAKWVRTILDKMVSIIEKNKNNIS
jgi:hypothetical protein